jgi:hypothetical protein
MIETVVLLGLSSFAITYILKYTRGPFEIFERFRIFIGLEIPVISYDVVGKVNFEDLKEDDNPDKFFAKLFGCHWCLTTWVSLFLSVLYYLVLGNDVATFLFVWFASIGISGIIFEVIT